MKLFMLVVGPAVVELLLLFTPLWNARRIVSWLLAITVTLSSIVVGFLEPGVGAYLFALINCYRVFNYGRIIEGRLHEAYLLASVRRAALWLLAGGVLSFGLAAWNTAISIWIIGLQILAGAVVFMSTRRQTRTTTPSATLLPNGQLPTVTVAIPARNETDDLAACLDSVLASDYQKLEILVLDDNSRAKAAEVIRSLAHDGVRFIPGDKPRRNWLAKNQAYQRLAREANGELILFCGVDIRFEPHSIRQLVSELVTSDKQMVCVMPKNESRQGDPRFLLLQPMRYAWELAFPRRFFRRPPVLSSCWLIRRQALKNTGGFAAVTRMIVPEAFFAREMLSHDGYRFLHGNKLLGITSRKSVVEQRATAIRTRYPQLHKRPELVCLTTIVALLAFVAPVPMLVNALLYSWPSYATAGLWVAVACQLAAYAKIVQVGFESHLNLNTMLLPVAVLADIALLNYSMWKYEFSQVIWKGRQVTDTVMHRTPHLPKV
ncbi:MAG: glycosyltransferase family 2 protein [Candidatus Saccharibacteria bacterium]|nr:glycosyltransferase family 2 protein [Candidatus Saccharibacteria bacterium]